MTPNTGKESWSALLRQDPPPPPDPGAAQRTVTLLRYLRPAAFSRAALGVVGGAWLVLLLPLSPFQHSLYAPQHQPLWAGALAVSLAALVRQTHRLTRTGPRTCL